MPQATIDVGLFYAALDKTRQGRGLSWRDLAAELEISPSTFTRMAQGRRPDVDTYASLVKWLGMPSEAFLRSDVSGVPTVPDPIAMISSYLRSSKNIAPEDAEALEDIIQAAYRRLVRK
jgi:transcriptional regulator with XRE-family HTH domain